MSPNLGKTNEIDDGSGELEMDDQNLEANLDDEDNYSHMGYLPLPQGPDGITAEEDDEEDLSVDKLLAEADLKTNVNGFSYEEIKERKELWKTSRDGSAMSAMGEDDADKIKSLMKGFILPANNIPDWANKIPEDKWISELLSKIASQSHH